MLRCRRRVWTSWMGTDHQPRRAAQSAPSLPGSLTLPHRRQTRLTGRQRPPNRSQSPRPSTHPARVISNSSAPHSRHGTSTDHPSRPQTLIASPPTAGAHSGASTPATVSATAVSPTGWAASYPLDPHPPLCQRCGMTDPTVRRAITELFAGQGWPDGGDELLRRSLGPRSPELLLDAPGWLGLGPGGLVLDAGCRARGAAARADRQRVDRAPVGARSRRPHPGPAGGGPAHARPGAHGGRAGAGLVPARPGVRALAPADPPRPAAGRPGPTGRGR